MRDFFFKKFFDNFFHLFFSLNFFFYTKNFENNFPDVREVYENSFYKLDLESLTKIHDTSIINQNEVYTGRTAIYSYNDWYIISLYAYYSMYITPEYENEDVAYSVNNYTTVLNFLHKNRFFFKKINKLKINFF